MAGAGSFPIRYGALRLLLTVLGMGPGRSGVELKGDRLRVRMGWAFRATIPLDQVTGAKSRQGLVGGIGVHGWRGRWLVNGATTGLVVLAIDPTVRAWATGVPVHVRQLTLSLESPDGFLAALGR